MKPFMFPNAAVHPKKALTKKLIRLNNDTSAQEDELKPKNWDGQEVENEMSEFNLTGETETPENITADSDTETYDELVALLPSVIQALKDSNKLEEFKCFHRLVNEKRFPI
ncbi:Hypothetical predicted protein [Mytilus galloprovincialis]|uniref:Uncharacterized protein n=1 Tax=Mytilus galloprovincialis TaxID=29158 RepID=A0A8B6CB73_MYTGA|nr:Hypothetical predicted protein [Mytilus galloprovincialis]